MIFNAILRGVKAVVDAIAKAIAWLLIALGLWVPLLYTLIFLIVVVAFTNVPLETTGTFYFLGLFLSFIGALWFSLVMGARKAKKRDHKKSNGFNLTDVKKKKSDNEETIEAPPQIKTEPISEQPLEQEENQMKDPYNNNQQRQFNYDNDPYGENGYYRQSQDQPRNNRSNEDQNYNPRNLYYNDPNAQPTYYNNANQKNWLSENPYLNNGQDKSQGYDESRANWLHEAQRNYEPRKNPTFEPYNTDQKQNNAPMQKPTFEPYNTNSRDNEQNNNNFQSPFTRDRRRASFDPYGNDAPKTQFEQSYGNNEPTDKNWINDDRNYGRDGASNNLGQDYSRSTYGRDSGTPSPFARDRNRASFEPYGNDEPKTQFEQNYGKNDPSNNGSTRSDRNFDRGGRTFDPYSDPQQRYNNDPYGGRPTRNNDGDPYNGQSQRYNDNVDPYNRYGSGQAYNQMPNNDKYDMRYDNEPPRQNGMTNQQMPQNKNVPHENYYNNETNGYNNNSMPAQGQQIKALPPRNPYEKPRIFRLREDPDMLVYEYSDRLDYYRRTPYGNEYVRTKMKY